MQLQKIAGWLMVLSGITHPSQLILYGTGPDILGPALFGAIFLPLGLWLLTGRRVALWVGAVLPLLAGIGSVYRILESTPSPLTHVHALLDFVVVGLCLAALIRTREPR